MIEKGTDGRPLRKRGKRYVSGISFLGNDVSDVERCPMDVLYGGARQPALRGEDGERLFERRAAGPTNPERDQQMNCLRCQGLMMAVTMKEAASCESISGWRCLLCGEAVDPGIEANRKHGWEPIRSRARPPGTLPAGSVSSRH